MIPKVFPSFTGSFKCFFVAYAVITCREIGGACKPNQVLPFANVSAMKMRIPHFPQMSWIENNFQNKHISSDVLFNHIIPLTRNDTFPGYWAWRSFKVPGGKYRVGKSDGFVAHVLSMILGCLNLMKNDQQWTRNASQYSVNLLALLLIQIRWNLNLRMGLSIELFAPHDVKLEFQIWFYGFTADRFVITWLAIWIWLSSVGHG